MTKQLFMQANFINEGLSADIESNFKKEYPLTRDFYANRCKYEKTMSLVNDKLVSILKALRVRVSYETNGFLSSVFWDVSIYKQLY